MVALKLAGVNVSFCPLCDSVALQELVTCWLPGQVQVTCQLWVAVVPVLATVTVAVKPVSHEFATYVALQPTLVVALWVVAVTEAEAGDMLPAASVALTV